MKSFLYLAAIAGVLSVVSAHPSQCKGKCPEQLEGDDVYLMPHENCTVFCACVHGDPIELSCPENLHYSPKDRVCTYPWQAECATEGNTPVLLRSFGLEESLEGRDYLCMGTCPADDLPDVIVTLEHQDCGKFCKCVKGYGQERDCPTGFHFSPHLGVCTYPHVAQCFRVTTTPAPTTPQDCCPCPTHPTWTPWTTTPTKPTTIPTESTTPIPTPTETTTPTQRPTETTTPTKPTQTTTETTVPTKPTQTTTETTVPTKPTQTTTETTVPTKPTQTTTETTVPTKPTQTTTETTIPTEPTQTPTETTTPIPIPTETTTPTKPTQIPTEPTAPTTITTPSGFGYCIGKCPPKDPVLTVHLPHTHCSKFCKCSNGTPYVFKCQPGLYFNPKLQVCDVPVQAGCQGIKD